MVLDKIIAFGLLYSLTATPLAGYDAQKKPLNLMARNVIAAKVPMGNNLEEEVKHQYAAQVVESETRKVIDAYNALGKADDKYARIMPGGELTLKMERPFGVMNFGNISGVVIARSGEYSLASFVSDAWREMVPGNIPGGFKVPQGGQIPVYIIKIKNIDTKPVEIDAVIE